MLALEWDQFEARIVAATVKSGELRIDHAFGVELAAREPGATMTEQQIGQRLQAALAARKIRDSEVLVAVGRSGIELRRLQLPPAPEAELPDMVRMAAAPQFSQLGDDWPLDYMPIDAGGSDGQCVVAAAISPSLVSQLQEICQAAGLNAKRLVLRPCATAALLLAVQSQQASTVRLLVDRLAEEADLSVLVDDHVALMRTVRLVGDDDSREQAAALVGEIRRTMAAAQNQLSGRPVEKIVLCGQPEEHLVLTATLKEKLEIPVESFEPLAGFSQGSELKSRPPVHPGRFAPLLGMLKVEAKGERPAIDFLSPRRRPDPPNRRRLYGIAAAAAVALVALVGAFLWWEMVALNHAIEDLQTQIDNAEPLVERSQETVTDVDLIEGWEGAEVNWLDELATLSSPGNFPPAEDAMVDRLTATTKPRGGAEMVLEGNVKDSAVVPNMEKQLRRRGQREVKSGTTRPDEENARYPWKYRENITLPPPAEAATTAASQGGQS